jgi:osmotically inducible protein OsmC
MAFYRKSTAVWNGTGKEGTGKLSSTSGVLNNTPYSFTTRFVSEDGKAGTNPEELIAAAHAGCFTMAFSFQLNAAGFTADALKTEATVTLEKVDGANRLTNIHLELAGTVPGIDNSKFQELAENAKKNCPISVALSAVPMTLSATLNN